MTKVPPELQAADLPPTEAPELDLGPTTALRKPPTIVHLPKLWTTEWSFRVSWLPRHDDKGQPILAEPPLPLSFLENGEPDRSCQVMIGGMEGSRSKMFIPDRHLTVAQLRLLAGLLSFRRPWEKDFIRERMGIKALYRKIKTGQSGRDDLAGGQRLQKIRDDLEEMETYWVQINRPWNTVEGQKVAEKLISFAKRTRFRDGMPHTQANIESEWIEAFRMNRHFLTALDADSRAVRLDVFNSFQTDMIALWYLVIPARASHPRITKNNPWQTGLRVLFDKAGCNIGSPGAAKWRFDRCHATVLNELNGSETMNGKFCCDLKKNSDGDDYLLRAWIERKNPRGKLQYNQEGFLFTFWLQAGRTEEEFEERLRRGCGPLSRYDEDLLTAARYPFTNPGNLAFLTQIKALLGEHVFTSALHTAKVSVLEYSMAGGCDPGRIMGTVLKDYYQRALSPG